MQIPITKKLSTTIMNKKPKFIGMKLPKNASCTIKNAVPASSLRLKIMFSGVRPSVSKLIGVLKKKIST